MRVERCGPSLRAGVWRLADPKISLASFAGMFLGTCAAIAGGPISIPWLVATILGVFAVEVAKNASGEIFDWDSGVDAAVLEKDRSPFSGGKRVLVDGLLTRTQTKTIAGFAYAIAALIGVVILVWREPRVGWLMLAGGGLAFFYHAPPLKLSYRGWGEVAVALAYGPGIVAGTYLVQRHAVSANVVALSVPLGLLIAAFLWINEFPDCLADRAAGKRNLVVRLGRGTAGDVFLGIVVAAFVALAAAPWFGSPPSVWLGGLAAIPVLRAAGTLRRHANETPRIQSAQKDTLMSFVVLALGAGIGVLIGG